MKKKLTKVQRRLAVVKDAIKQIKLNKYIPISGDVVEFLDGNIKDDISNAEDVDAKQVIKNLLKQDAPVCSVCARGSLLVSIVHKENNFKLSEFNSCVGSYSASGTTDTKLLTLFPEKQLALMEQAFEEGGGDIGWNALNHVYLTDDEVDKCSVFHDKYEDETSRLLGIFNNAVKNKGLFRP